MGVLVKRGQINKTITAAGTAEALSASSLIIVSYMIQANSTNTGKVYAGDSSVSSSVYGTAITAGNSESVEAPEMGMGGAYEMDLADVYLDVDTNGEGASVVYLYRV